MLQYVHGCIPLTVHGQLFLVLKVIALSSALQIIKVSETIALLIVADTEWTSSSDSGLTLP